MNYKTIRTCQISDLPPETNDGKPHLLISGSGELGGRVKRFLSGNDFSYSSFSIGGTDLFGIHVLFKSDAERQDFFDKWDIACKKDSQKMNEMLEKD